MLNVVTSPANADKTERLVAALEQLLEQALTRGFFGTLKLEAVVQDGTIQHIRRTIEQMEK